MTLTFLFQHYHHDGYGTFLKTFHFNNLACNKLSTQQYWNKKLI